MRHDGVLLLAVLNNDGIINTIWEEKKTKQN